MAADPLRWLRPRPDALRASGSSSAPTTGKAPRRSFPFDVEPNPMLPTIAGDHPKLHAMIRVSRRAPVAFIVALVLALVLPASGNAKRLLAPRKACADPSIAKLPLNKVVPSAPTPAKTRRVLAAMVCLHNYAHRRSGLPRFHVNRRLSRAAALKIRKMIACGEFGHTPCGINTATYEWQVGFTGTWWGRECRLSSRPGWLLGSAGDVQRLAQLPGSSLQHLVPALRPTRNRGSSRQQPRSLRLPWRHLGGRLRQPPLASETPGGSSTVAWRATCAQCSDGDPNDIRIHPLAEDAEYCASGRDLTRLVIGDDARTVFGTDSLTTDLTVLDC